MPSAWGGPTARSRAEESRSALRFTCSKHKCIDACRPSACGCLLRSCCSIPPPLAASPPRPTSTVIHIGHAPCWGMQQPTWWVAGHSRPAPRSLPGPSPSCDCCHDAVRAGSTAKCSQRPPMPPSVPPHCLFSHTHRCLSSPPTALAPSRSRRVKSPSMAAAS